MLTIFSLLYYYYSINFKPININFIKIIESPIQMESPLLPRHSLISQGRIHPKSQPSLKSYSPKVIDYKHTIRLITPFQCTHHPKISQLSQKHQLQIQKKDQLIEQLLDKIKQKDVALFQKEQQIIRLTNYQRKDECSTMTTSIVKNSFQKIQGFDLMASVAHSLPNLSFMRQSFIPNHQPISQLQISSADKSTYNNQFEGLQKTILDITTLTSKNRRKYQFFYSQQFKQRVQTLTFKDHSQKFQDTTNQQTERTNVLDDQFQNQSTNQSIDTQGFYETMMKQHQYLKEVLIELQSSTKKQIQQMKQGYQRQISRYQQQLALQRQKNTPTIPKPSRYKKVFQAQILQLKQSRIYQSGQFDYSDVVKLLNMNNKDLKSVLDND